MEAAMSTKHTLKLSSMLHSIVSPRDFSVHPLQPKLWSIKHEGVRRLKRGARLLHKYFCLHLLFLLLLFNFFFQSTRI